MRKPVVNYRNLRLSNITSPEYRHLLLLLGWLVYFALYELTEKLIPAGSCHIVHSTLDDLIPFCEWFVIPYVGWYALIVVSLLYFMLYNIQSFKNLQKFIILCQLIASFCYIVFPTQQLLRPEEFARDNLLTRLMAEIYAFDTNTGVCPSLHVALSIGITSTWLKDKTAPLWARIFVLVFSLIVILAVSFTKQHSVVDIYCAAAMCLFVEMIVYGKSYWLPKLKRK